VIRESVVAADMESADLRMANIPKNVTSPAEKVPERCRSAARTSAGNLSAPRSRVPGVVDRTLEEIEADMKAGAGETGPQGAKVRE